MASNKVKKQKIPLRVWENILTFLPADDLARMSLVNRRLRTMVAANDNLWLHHCINLIGDHWFAIVLPDKPKNTTFKCYYALLRQLCSYPPVPLAHQKNLDDVSIGYENWTRIDDFQFKHDIWNFLFCFPDICVDGCIDSQCSRYVNNIVCYLRNDICHDDLHLDEPMDENVEHDLNSLAFSFGEYHLTLNYPEERLHQRARTMGLHECLDWEFKSFKLNVSAISYENMTVYEERVRSDGTWVLYTYVLIVTSVFITRYFNLFIHALLRNKMLKITELYLLFGKIITKALAKYYSHHTPRSLSESEKHYFDTCYRFKDYVNRRRLDAEFDIMRLRYNMEFHKISETLAVEYFTDVLTAAVDEFVHLNKNLYKMAGEMQDGIESFVMDFVKKYQKKTQTVSELYVPEVVRAFINDDFDAKIMPIRRRIEELLLDNCDGEKQVRRVMVTNMENDHDSNCVRMILTEKHAVFVFECIPRC